MLSLLEYRIFKAFSKFPNYFAIPTDRFEDIDEHRFNQRILDVYLKTNIPMCHINTTVDKLIELKYMVKSLDITQLGYSELKLFWKKWLSHFFSDSFFKWLSAIATVLSIASLIISLSGKN